MTTDIIAFIDDRLDLIVSRPRQWGPSAALESIVLVLLQARAFAVRGSPDDAAVTETYRNVLRHEYPAGGSLPAWERVDAARSDVELPALMRTFIAAERERQSMR